MEFYPIEMRTNYMKSEYAACENGKPIFTWGAVSPENGACQRAYHIVVVSGGKCYWDSGSVKSENQRAVYDGDALDEGALYEWTLELEDNFGNISRKGKSSFKTVFTDEWHGKWIECETEGSAAEYFSAGFTLDALPERAALYHSGIGLDKAYINGKGLNDYRLQPPFTNYKKECRYVCELVDVKDLKIGENVIEITAAGGWRQNYGSYLDNLSEKRKIEFMGNIRLNAQLVLYFGDGTKKIIATDEDWKCTSGAVVYAHLFNGEIYDEHSKKEEYNPVVKSDFDIKSLKPQTIEPVRVKRRIKPVADYYADGKHIFDFGENTAGAAELRVRGECRGRVGFKIKYSELTDERGRLFRAPLRGARAEDIYFAADGKCDICYAPEFTYHGFRYASLEIDGEFDGAAELEAVCFYTDIDADNYFKCSDTTVNEFYNCVLRTERSNMHSIATDCPQRDERMGWLNDATVRFPAMKYSFMPIRLFEKFVGDVTNEQDGKGRITCTAPFVYGERPADPVCSSYLIAAREHYTLTGSTALIEKYYDNFVLWNEYLKSRRKNGIVDYSYYGDWAGPEDCCYNKATIGNSDTKKLEEYDTGAANSVYVPGELISTAFHYMNYKMLTEFAALTGKSSDAARFEAEAKVIFDAFNNKWCRSDGSVHNGSQACQALALFAEILPKGGREKAAKIMKDAVSAAGGRIQTGNITTPMLLKMLASYGYTDTMWSLLSRTEYPSWGYMISCGATTVWERFELKKNGGMNSHNHPMYGAAAGVLYEGLAGFKTDKPLREYTISPRIPDGVKFYEMKIPTLSGTFYIRAENKYGAKTLCVSVPFGLCLNVVAGSKTERLGSGFYSVNIDSGEEEC